MTSFEDYRKALGVRIHGLRSQTGMSLRAFGLLSGVHHNQLHNIERGRTNPSLETLYKIASGLDMEIHNLLDISK